MTNGSTTAIKYKEKKRKPGGTNSCARGRKE